MLEPRGAVSADLRVGEQPIRVIGAHLDLSGLRRKDQLSAILRHCGQATRSIPTVIMGDFNQWGHSTGAMRVFGDAWQPLVPGASFPSRRPIAALDRIVVSDDWHVEAHAVHHSALAVQASDHLPVYATLALPNF